MLNYEMVDVITSPLVFFSINQLLGATFYADKQHKKMKYIVFFAFFLVTTYLLFITRTPIVTLIVTTAFIFMLTLCYESTFDKKIICTSGIISLNVVIETIVAIVLGFTNLSATSNSEFNSLGGILMMKIILLVISYLFNRYTISIKKDFALPKIYYLMFSIVLIGTLHLFIASLESNRITITDIIINGFILLTVNVTIMIADEKIYHSLLIANEKKLLEQQNIAYENQMNLIHQSAESTRLLKHDFKNHLLMLEQLYETQQNHEAKMYTSQLVSGMQQGAFCNSGNFVVDSILNFKLNTLKEQNVHLSIVVNIPQTVHILAHDITVILGNLLDNAITATLQSKQKILEIDISTKLDNLIILIDNSYDGKIREENGVFQTTKAFTTSHGLGLTSVKKALAIYGGDVTIHYTSERFSVSVMIPY